MLDKSSLVSLLEHSTIALPEPTTCTDLEDTKKPVEDLGVESVEVSSELVEPEGTLTITEVGLEVGSTVHRIYSYLNGMITLIIKKRLKFD